jgi:hypothetical protein
MGQAAGRAGTRGVACGASTIASLLVALARLDALAKGIGIGNPWDELETVALALAGAPVQ